MPEVSGGQTGSGAKLRIALIVVTWVSRARQVLPGDDEAVAERVLASAEAFAAELPNSKAGAAAAARKADELVGAARLLLVTATDVCSPSSRALLTELEKLESELLSFRTPNGGGHAARVQEFFKER